MYQINTLIEVKFHGSSIIFVFLVGVIWTYEPSEGYFHLTFPPSKNPLNLKAPKFSRSINFILDHQILKAKFYRDNNGSHCLCFSAIITCSVY
ncbi:unnamed protein product [Lactuca virosa]|uniref:Uncharacterized protein n=1 Tax=Lactuca virosa TaxID=75947 RepID=A0AAU9P898_9ASTR|nr:unnamed protein product [Lactuca virosa]